MHGSKGSVISPGLPGLPAVWLVPSRTTDPITILSARVEPAASPARSDCTGLRSLDSGLSILDSGLCSLDFRPRDALPMARRLGTIMIDMGYLDEEALWKILEEQKRSGSDLLGKVAVRMGLV